MDARNVENTNKTIANGENEHLRNSAEIHVQLSDTSPMQQNTQESGIVVYLNDRADAGFSDSQMIQSRAETDQATVMNRLSKIREYKRQVITMMDQMKDDSDEIADKDTLRKLVHAYDQFKDQEEQYLQMLQIILARKEEILLAGVNNPDNSLEISVGPTTGAVSEDMPTINHQGHRTTDSFDAQASRDLLTSMTTQQENLKALLGHLDAKNAQVSRSADLALNGQRDDRQLLAAQRTVENQAASLAAKRRELEELKERLSLVNSLADKTASFEALHSSQDELLLQNHQQTDVVVENQISQLDHRQRLIEQITGAMAEFEAPVVVDVPGLLADGVGGTHQLTDPPEAILSGIDIRGSLEKKYNELLATKKRIAEIQSLMSTLEQKGAAMLQENEPVGSSGMQKVTSQASYVSPGGARRARVNNNFEGVKIKNQCTQQLDVDGERESLLAIRQQLLSMNDEQLSELSSRNHLADCQQTNAAENLDSKIARTGGRTKPQNSACDQHRLNNVVDNVSNFLPCRIAKQPGSKVQEDSAAYCFMSDMDEDQFDDNPAGSALGPAVPNRSTSHTSTMTPRSTLTNFRRNNDINVGMSAQNVARFKNAPQASVATHRKQNANAYSNAIVPPTMHSSDVNLLNGTISSVCDGQDSLNDQLTQHIESIRSIFESLMMTSSSRNEQLQNCTSMPPNRMTSSLPVGLSGSDNPIMTSSINSIVSLPAAVMNSAATAQGQVVVPQEFIASQQQLAMTMLQCQQELQGQQRQLANLYKMYQELVTMHYSKLAAASGGHPMLQPAATNMAAMNAPNATVNSSDGRPLSTTSLYNLFAPNPYLGLQHQQPLFTQSLSRSVSGDIRRNYGKFPNAPPDQQQSMDIVQQQGRRGDRSKRSASVHSDSRLVNKAASCLSEEPFDSLRESIYSEVATLISQNEQRPHYLLELFRELQLLSSDTLRGKAFRAIRDILNRYLVEETEAPHQGLFHRVRQLVDESVQINRSGLSSEDEVPTSEKIISAPHTLGARSKNKIMTLSDGRRPRSTNVSTVSSTPIRRQEMPFDERLRKIGADLRTFVATPGAAVTVCSTQFLHFVRKFVAALVASSKCMPMDGDGAFLHQKLAGALHGFLAAFRGRRLHECQESLVNGVMEIIKEHSEFYIIMQNIDRTVDSRSGNTNNTTVPMMPFEIKANGLHRHSPDNTSHQLFSAATSLRSPSELGEVLHMNMYRDEMGTMDNALAFIDDEFKDIERSDTVSNYVATPPTQNFEDRSTVPKFQ